MRIAQRMILAVSSIALGTQADLCLGQGNVSYPVTGYAVTRVKNVNDPGHFGYVALFNGNRAVAYLVISDTPAKYGSYNANDDYLVVPWHTQDSSSILDLLRNERAQVVTGSYDATRRVTFFVLHTERRVAIGGANSTQPDNERHHAPIGAAFKRFSEQRGILVEEPDDAALTVVEFSVQDGTLHKSTPEGRQGEEDTVP